MAAEFLKKDKKTKNSRKLQIEFVLEYFSCLFISHQYFDIYPEQNYLPGQQALLVVNVNPNGTQLFLQTSF